MDVRLPSGNETARALEKVHRALTRAASLIAECFVFFSPPLLAQTSNYGEALLKSLLCYEAQRSGELPVSNLLN